MVISLRKLLFSLYPCLYAAIPCLHLYLVNLDEFPYFSDSHIVLLSCMGLIAGLTFLALTLSSKFGMRQEKVRVWLAAMWLFFFSFGHLVHAVGKEWVGGRIRYWYVLLFVAIVAMTVSVLRSKKRIVSLDRFLAVSSAWMLMLTVFQFSQHLVTKAPYAKTSVQKIAQNADSPDVYFLLLDMYGGKKTLENLYGFRNPLLDQAKELGFHSYDKSHAHYAFTFASIASLLNTTYLPSGEFSKSEMVSMIHKSQVAKTFQSRGYKHIVISNKAPFSEIVESDLNISCPTVDPFLVLLFKTSALTVLEGYFTRRYWVAEHRNKVKCALANLKEAIDLPGPKFVYFHLLSPHPPIVFDKDGGHVPIDHFTIFGDVNSQESAARMRKLFVGQTQWLNSQILPILKEITERSSRAPVVFVQSDHGPSFGDDWVGKSFQDATDEMVRERLGNLNLIYVPTDDQGKLPGKLLPVNTFRWFFREYFGDEREDLPQRAFFERDIEGKPFFFRDVTHLFVEKMG